MAVPRQMNGKVTRQDGKYYVIECPEAPAHLQTLNLIRSQMAGATVGDSVTLEYQVTSRSGLWNVIKVLDNVS